MKTTFAFALLGAVAYAAEETSTYQNTLGDHSFDKILADEGSWNRAGHLQYMTPNQALNIMESDPLSTNEYEEDYALEKWGLYEEKPKRFVGRRSRFGKEFGCYWPSNMSFQGAEYESQSAYCKSE